MENNALCVDYERQGSPLSAVGIPYAETASFIRLLKGTARQNFYFVSHSFTLLHL